MGTILSTSGRLNRRGWWILQTCSITVLACLAYQTAYVLMSEAVCHELHVVALYSGIAIGLLLTWINIAASIKRYHDLDKSGLWICICLIPVAGLIWQIAQLGFIAGNSGDNRYGTPPKELSMGIRPRGWIRSKGVI